MQQLTKYDYKVLLLAIAIDRLQRTQQPVMNSWIKRALNTG